MLGKTRREETAKCRLETASENGAHSCKYSTAEFSSGSQIHLPGSKGRAAMHAAAVPRDRRLDFFPEVIMTMTKLDCG